MVKEILSYPWTLMGIIVALLLYLTPLSDIFQNQLRGTITGSQGWVGVVTSEPTPGQNGLLSFTMDVRELVFSTGKVPVSGQITILGWGGQAPVLGQVWQVTGRLSRKGPGVLGRIQTVEGWSWNDDWALVRNGWRRAFFKVLEGLPPGPGALGKALVLGATEDLTPREKSAFRESGTSHVLALSGMHLSLLSVIFNGLFSPFLGRRNALILTGLILIIFVWLAGPIPSLMRSLFMYFLISCHLVLGFKVSFVEILSQTFLLSTLIWPAGSYSLSMELSFLSLLGMALFGPRLELLWKPRLSPPGATALSTGVGATLGTLPLTSALFGVFHPEGVILSIPMVFSTTLLIFLTVGYGLVGALLPFINLGCFHPIYQWIYDFTMGMGYLGVWIPGLKGLGLILVLVGEGLFLLWFFFYKRRYDSQLRFSH